MMEFTFDDVASPWELAAARLKKGDVLNAVRFLGLVRSSEEVSSEDAAMELEAMGVMLDVSELPKLEGNSDTAARLRLESQLLEQGGWSETLDDKDPLRLFVEELAYLEPVDDGAELAAQGACGDQKALQKLTDGYLNTVFACAREYADRGVLLMDLIQEGSLGLWQAALSYESGPFRPHALWWIRQAMARAVTLQAEADGVGDHLAGQIDRYQKADKSLLSQLGRNPTDQELAVELGLTLEETVSLGKMLREIRKMAELKKENSPPEEDPEDEMPIEDTAYYQTRERVSDLMSGLTERETMVLNLRYGLNGKAPMTAQEVAAKLNITAADVTALEAAALVKMRGEG